MATNDICAGTEWRLSTALTDTSGAGGGMLVNQTLEGETRSDLYIVGEWQLGIVVLQRDRPSYAHKIWRRRQVLHSPTVETTQLGKTHLGSFHLCFLVKLPILHLSRSFIFCGARYKKVGSISGTKQEHHLKDPKQKKAAGYDLKHKSKSLIRKKWQSGSNIQKWSPDFKPTFDHFLKLYFGRGESSRWDPLGMGWANTLACKLLAAPKGRKVGNVWRRRQ